MAKKGKDYQGPTDGSYSNLNTPLNVPKADPDPQAAYDNSAFPGAKGEGVRNPMGIEGID